jgi:DNA polymerase-3 subunit epsilon
MREIAIDTETTGISPRDGHRIIEIGALELMHHLPTGRQLHLYINPERDIDEGAIAVHGITSGFLADKPVFADIADEFLAFIGSDLMVIHNASFDMAFINVELARLGRPVLAMNRSLDTLALARKKFPGAQANLDALCRRFEIENTHRDLHGALVDADLLASVYIELLGGRQPGLLLDGDQKFERKTLQNETYEDLNFQVEVKNILPTRAHAPTEEELVAHAEFVGGLKNPIWHQK